MKFLNKIILLLPICVLMACESPSKVEVAHSGALMDIMSGNIEATISLEELENTSHLYALGAKEDLQGEILILDGEVMVSSLSDSTLVISRSFNHNAALLVYTSVEEWNEVTIPKEVVTKNDLESFVKKAAASEGIPVDKPIPFLIEGKVKSLDYHVIDWDVNDKVHTHEKHQNSGIKDRLVDAQVTVLGFYSEAHKGIFTHHSTNVHIHFKLNSGEQGIAGHVDDVEVGENMVLKLPKQ